MFAFIAGTVALTGSPLAAHAPTRTPSPVMGEMASSRRALLGALPLLAVPSVASAMPIPGLNSPGLVPAQARRVTYKDQIGRDDFDYVRESEINHFWNPKGIVNSVPKMKGIITPKSAIPGTELDRDLAFSYYTKTGFLKPETTTLAPERQ